MEGGRVAQREGGRVARREGGWHRGREGGRVARREGGRVARREGGWHRGREGGWHRGREGGCDQQLFYPLPSSKKSTTSEGSHLKAMMLPGQKSSNVTSCVPLLPVEAKWHITDCESGICVCISSTWDCSPFTADTCFWKDGASGVHCTSLASRITS